MNVLTRSNCFFLARIQSGGKAAPDAEQKYKTEIGKSLMRGVFKTF